MTKLIGNLAILVAGSALMIGGLITISVIFVAAAATVLVRRVFSVRDPAMISFGT